HNIVFYEIDDLTLLPPAIDVIYQTRIQKERLGIGGADFDYSASRERFSICAEGLERFSKETIVMHPLPRNPVDNELATDVDQDPRAKYFSQAQNGLFVRMALLKMILGNA
ncbi:MAG: aspartate carbamoyltransferase, partial [Candidatus Portnoybacteria bacterium]|nr:aspartate carbamoyltransferase [Candidatus Portnoybacteria bacterium]